MVPVELEMIELMELYPTDNIKGFHKDKVYFVCDSIYRGMAKLNDKMIHPDKKEPYFVPLKTEIFRKVLGGNCYKGILDWMNTAGIIKSDGKWESKKVALGFKFSEFFIDSECTWKTVKCKTILNKNLSDCFKHKYHFQPAIVKRLDRWFKTGKLKIDQERAMESIEARRVASVDAANGNFEKLRKAQIAARIDSMKVEKIASGQFSQITQDDFGYRIHTTLTQLPKLLRSYVTYDGKPLVEVDISCSQLFFSIFLLDHRHWQTPKFKTYKRYTKEIWKNISIVSNNNSSSNSQYSNTIMNIIFYETRYGQGFQGHQFLKKCCEGVLYESVVDELSRQDFFDPAWDYQRRRKWVKKLLLDQLFANPTDPEHRGLFCVENKPILDAFAALYPEVACVYQRIKEGREKDRYKDLCKLFQRVESVAMQGCVCKRLQEDYPAIPIFTLHDCLITTVGNEDIITKVMQEEITKYMGYTPKMKPTYWTKYAELIPERIELAKAA